MTNKTDIKTSSAAFRKIASEFRGDQNSEELFPLLADTFKTLGDVSRLRIVWALSKGALCVGDIASLVGMSPSAVSHHLRTLRNLRLVQVQRKHREIFYRLDDNHINALLEKGVEHVEELLQ
jgi:DNA-binding transcriptional ArsR family regulator